SQSISEFAELFSCYSGRRTQQILNSKLATCAVSAAAFNSDVAYSVKNTITPARYGQNRRKRSLAFGFFSGVVFYEWVIGEQVLIDPILGIARSRNVCVNVRRIPRAWIRGRFDGAKFVTASPICTHQTVDSRAAIVAATR